MFLFAKLIVRLLELHMGAQGQKEEQDPHDIHQFGHWPAAEMWGFHDGYGGSGKHDRQLLGGWHLASLSFCLFKRINLGVHQGSGVTTRCRSTVASYQRNTILLSRLSEAHNAASAAKIFFTPFRYFILDQKENPHSGHRRHRRPIVFLDVLGSFWSRATWILCTFFPFWQKDAEGTQFGLPYVIQTPFEEVLVGCLYGQKYRQDAAGCLKVLTTLFWTKLYQH